METRKSPITNQQSPIANPQFEKIIPPGDIDDGHFWIPFSALVLGVLLLIYVH
jgi:hypothetical protein